MTANDEQYVPSEDDVRARYVLAGLPDHATSDQMARASNREAPEFDRFLARVWQAAKAEGWDEGYLDRSPYGGRARSRADNPYHTTEKETGHDD